MIQIYTDAAYHPVQKTAGIGIVIDGAQRYQYQYYLTDVDDNHQAEFAAAIIAMHHLKGIASPIELIQYQSDSQIVIDSIHKRYAKKERYERLLENLLRYIDAYSLFFAKWVSERDNRYADQLARQALHQAKEAIPIDQLWLRFDCDQN